MKTPACLLLVALSALSCKGPASADGDALWLFEFPPTPTGGHRADGSPCEATPLGKAPFGANVRASSEGVVSSETTIAADLAGHVVTSWIEINPAPAIGVSTSSDNGATFTRSGVVSDENPQSSDPVLQLTADGLFHLTFITFQVSSGSPTNMHVAVASSADFGKTWSKAVTANDASDGPIVDKPWLAAGPDGELIVSYLATTSNGAATEIRVRRQPKGQGAFGPAIAADPGKIALRNFGYPSVSPQGDLYLAYMELGNLSGAGGLEKDEAQGDEKNRILVARQDRGAAGFSAPVDVAPKTLLPIFMPVALATGPDGSVYCAFIGGEKNHSDLFVARSTDRAATFGAPVKVNDDPTCATHFRPSLAVDAAGRVHVTYLDNRGGEGNAIYAVSTDKGATFTNSRLSDQSFPFTIGRAPLEHWLGDYIHVALAGSRLFEIWADPRSGKSSAYVSVQELK